MKKPCDCRLFVNVPISEWSKYSKVILDNLFDVELYVSANDIDNISSFDPSDICRQMRQKDLKVSVHAPYMDLSPGALDEQIREVTVRRFFQTMEIASELGAETIIFHHGYDRKRYKDVCEEWFDQSRKTWTSIAGELKKRKLFAGFENVFDESPEVLKRLFDMFDNGSFGWCLDVGHLNLFSNVVIDRWFKEIGDKLMEIHLHDNWGINDDHMAIGDGSIDFGPVKEFLISCEKLPNLILEIRSEEDAKKSIEKVVSWFSKKVYA